MIPKVRSAILAILFLFAILPVALNAQQSFRDVMIGIDGRPTSNDELALIGIGAEVRRVYEHIDVIHALLPEGTITTLKNYPRIRFIEENIQGAFKLHSQVVPWGVDRVFDFSGNVREETWTLSGAGAGVTVAIIDTGLGSKRNGVPGYHEDFYVVAGGENFAPDLSQWPVPPVDPDDWQDDLGHGTQVAGVVMAADNFLGVVGVAPEISVYGLKVGNETTSGIYQPAVVDALMWCIDENVNIANMSFGGSTPHQGIYEAILAAYESGVLIIASAGNNSGGSVDFPAAHCEVMAVNGSNSSDDINYSGGNWSEGTEIELIAPGEEILTTIPNNSYTTSSGTSLAAPHVTGTAALVLAANPELSNVDIRKILLGTAENLNISSDLQGFGLVRADHAVTIATAPGPNWWKARGVVTLDEGDDFAVANVGQLKHIALQAYHEMEGKLEEGAGEAIETLIAGWENFESADDFLAVNIGQVKNVASLFYERMGMVYPWVNSPEPADDYGLANIGQIKHLFSFTVD